MTDKSDKKSLDPLTLSEGEIGTRRGMGRRSFLLGAVGSTAALAGCAGGLTDADAGQFADPAGMGRGTTGSGITDSDVGVGADPAGRGRGRVVRRVSGITDSDSGFGADPAGNGRGRVVRRSCSDSDVGPIITDPVGRGRRC
jgi:hypothetical protein